MSIMIKNQIEVITQRLRPYTMISNSGIEFIISTVKQVIDNKVSGDFVECGVWKGGCSAAMILAQMALQPNQQRLSDLFDSYEGLPAAESLDGPMALQWQSNVDSPGYYDNCTAWLETVQHNFELLGIPSCNTIFHKGWFEETIPRFVQEHPNLKIAIVRLDGNWYTSTKVCIENLYPLVSEKGIAIIDGYYAWDGCVAIHEFLGKHKLNHRLRSLSDFLAAYFIKKKWQEQ